MTSCWKKPTSSVRQQELQWMNIIFQSHDQMCHCEDPQLHFMILLNKTGNAPKPESEIKNIKCLLTGQPTGETKDTEEDNGGFLEGELQKLFEEDDGGAANIEEPTTR